MRARPRHAHGLAVAQAQGTLKELVDLLPGGKMELAMQLIFTPFIWRMMERKRRLIE